FLASLMEIVIIVVFVAGYIAIALEHPLKINKTASAILTGVICWTLLILSEPSSSLLSSDMYQSFLEILRLEKGDVHVGDPASHETFREFVIFSLSEHLSQISQILFFLMGAMTIVELVDAHHGFRFITQRIQTKKLRTLLWVVCCVTFVLSAILDNLTTSIVMVSLIRKLIPHRKLRLFFV